MLYLLSRKSIICLKFCLFVVLLIFTFVEFSLSHAARTGVERMWSKWGSNSIHDQPAPSVCPLMLQAGTGLKSGIVAHFGGSHLN